MILRQLLERLMAFGVVCVMTSKYVYQINQDELTTSRHPDELYINGIQRESFLPAIQLIKDRFEVVDLNSPTGQFKITLTMELNSRLPKNAPSPLKSLLRPSRYSKPPRTPEDIYFISIKIGRASCRERV